MFRRRNILINSALVIVLGVIGFFGWRTLYPPVAAAAVQTTAVSVQDVSSSVSATGTVQPANDLGANFGSSGLVKTINVAVGDHVKKGQLLATLDDRAENLALVQSRTSLVSAQVSLKNAHVGVDNAQLAITQGAQSAEQTQTSDDLAIQNAKTALAKLQAGPTAAVLAQQQQQLVVSQQGITNAQIAVTNAQASLDQVKATNALNSTGYDTAITNALEDYNLKCSALPTATDCTTATASRPSYLSWQSAISAKATGLLRDSQSLANAQTNLDSANRGITTAMQSYDTLKAQQVVSNQPATQADIDQATASVTSAQNAKSNAAALAVIQAQQAQNSLTTAQGTLSNAEQSLALAKANLNNAKVNESNTRLYAPISATVAAIANEVGANAGSTTSGSASGFIVLTDLSGLQVSATFAEADIVSLKVGQKASFTFDAIANSSASGQVISVAPLSNGTSTSGSVTSYNVTFSLVGAPKGIKPGMTAQVSVVTAQALGVLAVRSTALIERGTIYTVTMKPTKVGVPGERKIVTVGLKGDTTTEITSGLKAGDEVELPTVASTSANSGFPAGGIPGGPGGAIGGGIGAGG